MTDVCKEEISGLQNHRGINEGSGTLQEQALFEHLLAGVSRTFALTIPQLPDGLRETVTNAYLLCRIADTIEDDPDLDPETKDTFHNLFLDAVRTGRGAEIFALNLYPRLAPSTLDAEVELVRESPRVLAFTHQLQSSDQAAVHRCLTTMSRGMAEFERHRSQSGLADVAEFERYCYFVAGVVGEMLTELFCGHSPQIEANREELEARSVSFGLGLQMVNILKDIWDDQQDGVCWLPREVFESHGYDLGHLDVHHNGQGPAFESSVQHMVGIAHGHLREALDYTLAMPANEVGIRRFLIWAALLAVSTLRNISAQPLFTSGAQVKVSRRRLAAIMTLSNAVTRSNWGLATLFNVAASGLPLGRGEESVQIADQKREKA